jgi:hypothetical protein
LIGLNKMKLEISGLDGKENWIEETISPNKSLLVIEAKAKADLRITFSESKSQTLYQSSKDCYNFVIGGYSNSTSYIRRKNESSSPKLATSSIVCDANVYQTYWFNLDYTSGVISCGKGIPSLKNTILQWKDEKFLSKVKYIGISNFNDPIKISKIKIENTLKPIDFNLDYNEGYLYGSQELGLEPNYQLSKLFISEYLKLDENLFSFDDNCYYLKNYCHIEKRGGHRYLRASECSKFVLKSGKKLFYNDEWLYSYHGTDPKNIEKIIQYGLKVPGSKAGNDTVEVANGNSLGVGIYTSKVPLYSQLYAPLVQWKGKYFQTLFIVRQDPKSVSQSSIEGCYTTSMIGRTDIHELYGGLVSENEVQLFSTDENAHVLHALLIKVHDSHPCYSGGEYSKIGEIIDSKKI